MGSSSFKVCLTRIPRAESGCSDQNDPDGAAQYPTIARFAETAARCQERIAKDDRLQQAADQGWGDVSIICSMGSLICLFSTETSGG